ncbi:MAG: UDP-N-acetylglucosamine 2-epimerase (non-hydrolyzing) [Candidatus Eisenbacteria bacterium]|nr:UDP-N-acetylglucosamine 2-epimerase (non-hydrolyzing) [Candidatus Eisenbacteria bacterium]
MGKRWTVAVVIGTRPEAIKMAPVVLSFRESDAPVRVVTVLTAQHREMSDEVLRLFRIEPDQDLNVMRPGQSLFETIARLLPGLERVYREEKPDLVLVQGDTTTTFVGGLAAYYLRVPVGHVEAGLRTRDKHNPFPEEINRRLTTVVADLHFAPTETARRALLAEGVPEKSIHVTGNTVIDALFRTLRETGEGGKEELLPAGLDRSRRWVLVTSHRRENWGAPLESICGALSDLTERYGDLEVIYPVHPNPNVRRTTDRLLRGRERIHLIEPLDYVRFVHLMNEAHLLITDSGGVQEEAPSLGKPVLVIREKTERPEAVEAGTVRLVGTDRERIVAEASRLLDSPEAYEAMARRHNPYGDGKACPRIVRAVTDWLSHERG